MKQIMGFTLAIVLNIILAACAHRYYLGFHGPTVKTSLDIHSGFTKDAECLGCHGEGEESQGTPTSHPQFKGCLKCHND